MPSTVLASIFSYLVLAAGASARRSTGRGAGWLPLQS